MKIPNGDMKPGMRYRITFEDCCVQGDLVGTFQGWEDEDGEHNRAIFDFGKIGPCGSWYGAWEVEEG